MNWSLSEEELKIVQKENEMWDNISKAFNKGTSMSKIQPEAWTDTLRKLEEEETRDKAYGDVPIITPPPQQHKPVIVFEAETFVQAAKLCFRTMTYGEVVYCAERLAAQNGDLAKSLWEWANEDTNND